MWPRPKLLSVRLKKVKHIFSTGWWFRTHYRPDGVRVRLLIIIHLNTYTSKFMTFQHLSLWNFAVSRLLTITHLECVYCVPDTRAWDNSDKSIHVWMIYFPLQIFQPVFTLFQLDWKSAGVSRPQAQNVTQFSKNVKVLEFGDYIWHHCQTKWQTNL